MTTPKKPAAKKRKRAPRKKPAPETLVIEQRRGHKIIDHIVAEERARAASNTSAVDRAARAATRRR